MEPWSPARIPVEIRERDLRNHWSMFGVASCVERIGRKWQVMYGLVPVLFNTKTEAMDACDRLVLAICRRNTNAR